MARELNTDVSAEVFKQLTEIIWPNAVEDGDDAVQFGNVELYHHTVTVDQVPVGLCISMWGNPHSRIVLLGVRPKWRRMGHGLWLLQQVEQLMEGESNGFTAHIARGNTAAQGLFEKAGYFAVSESIFDARRADFTTAGKRPKLGGRHPDLIAYRKISDV